jgi:hypothetical protein
MTRTIFGWMQTRRAWAILAAAFLLLLVGAASASAQTQITFSNSSQNVSFQATSGTSMNVGLGCPSDGFTGSCVLSGTAYFGADVGSYSFTTAVGTPITASTSSPTQTVFPIDMHGNTTAFTWLAGDGDSLTGSVTWTTVSNGSTNPHFNGTLSGVIATGDTAFTSVFSSSTAAFDLILNQLQCNHAPAGGCNLEALFTDTTAIGLAPVSGGQLTSTTPEPASMLLFGSGLLACGAFIRRRESVPVGASA